MADRHDRARIALLVATQRSDAFLSGLKQQVKDVKDVGTEILNGGYSTDKWIADATALWINASALAGALYGLPLPPTDAPDDEEDDSDAE